MNMPAETRGRISSSMITAIAAGIVSLSALGVSIYEAYLMREQQAASVLPIVDFWSAYDHRAGYSLNLANKGLGPAFVRDIEVSVDGTPLKHWTAVTKALTGELVPHAESAIIGSVLAPGDQVAMLAIDEPGIATTVWQSASRLAIKVCYCSVFEHCWFTIVSDVNTGTPENMKIDACPIGKGRGF